MTTIAVIGAGKLGELVLSGLLRADWPVGQLMATTRRPERATELGERYGIRTVTNRTAFAEADVLLIAVKPADAPQVLTDFGGALPPGRLVVSLCAGLPTSVFSERLPDGVPVVRVMTNTPAQVGQAMTAISAGRSVTDEHLALVEDIFRPLGRTVRVPEAQQDAVTAVSGSGPAYLFLVVEAMVDAGVLLGLPRQTAHELAVQTALGAATMLSESGEQPASLRAAVSSPGGTTVAAVRQLEVHGVRAAFYAALEAARNRSRELG
ncbi:pyrroline-5-carboxylate reductase [Actinoplanes sp. TBRC 11911]|uniref:pyrroline-5-carboxylate reductase n=1 Tax=Actinoplanes sp. TBRC 11911 TaxID=2729386 RepID=UPI00145DCF80|nr:pyrroline-5-carboxylate reductase [Actinoplanes sp. TBRC 11911]NMO53114.1 pyrroline-5-carboxylate reductase [Actinoplanes sp. TBRC 11911]